MHNGSPGKQGGFAYLSVIILVAVVSIMALQMSGTLAVRLNRDKEADLLFKGDQIAQAIRSYYESGPVPGCYPRNLEVLLEDRRNFKTLRHLRQIYRDPMHTSANNSPNDSTDILADNSGTRFITSAMSRDAGNNGGWEILRNETNHVIGVQSKSTNTPYQQGNFPEAKKDFRNKSRYDEWKFVAKGSTVKAASPGACNQ
ncbi:hypothetical protein ACVBEF_04305 [Glaciimonas sp. GG7]